MSDYIVPTRTDVEHYEQQVELDVVFYTLLLAWNHRAESWFISLSLADGTPIMSGMKVVADTPLLYYCGHPQKPPGDLLALDTSGAGVSPGLDDLGVRVLLVYRDGSG